ncbi:MalY/PatB family protein [Pontibacillus marinus]|uniref:cysteine-S-conjugate beta-lyase n=1 Tax=Pontibacillus marinus BH030004 = DSM 16465 TaxID=1385511 RepID=A0A0A5HHT0_9BACI|nr:PatB family C-S lyase [Pontibacillus marinus]KGX83217.1 cystathionine beta-lyase [Pontibacillus marinus BH030004 = DSM 16465]
MSKFQKVTNRLSTRSVKWDWRKKLFNSEEVLPMWVADMDFEVPEAVKNALIKRAEHGIFGYTLTDQKVNETIQNWLKSKHDWEIEKDWLTYSPGVVPTLHTIIEALTSEEDKVLIQTPVYPPFFQVVNKHNRTLVKNPLQIENGRYEIDFKDLEEKLASGVKAFILCNPHNPVGRVWQKDELQKMADLCMKHDVLIISDEIHSDLVYPGYKHIPIASLSKDIEANTITCMAPSKTFNLAGLQASYVITPDKKMREAVNEQFGLQGLNMLNTMGITAMEAAYEHGGQWLEELIQVIKSNKDRLMERLHSETETIKVIEPEGTYLVWLDCREMGLSHSDLKQWFVEGAKVGLNDGASFGEDGEGFMRINIACPPETLEEGINRIVNATNAR